MLLHRIDFILLHSVTNARKIEQLKQKIETVITSAQTWYNTNSMKNNIGKTEVIVFNITF